MKRVALIACGAALLAALVVSGCVFVRSTEQRIVLHDDGSGEATMRLKDIRSEADVDSIVKRDFAVLMISAEGDGTAQFEQNGRKVVSKGFIVSGDTLGAEVTYRFSDLKAIEGLHVTSNEMYLVVPDSREVVRSNGSLSTWSRNEMKLSWPRSTRKLYYEIREKNLGVSTQLGSLYRRYVKK